MLDLMIVDDEPNVLYSFEKAICSHRQDVRVRTAETGSAALAKFEDALPDAVILDICLPDISGLEVFERIHRVAPQLPVIIVTAHASTDKAIEATKRGAFDFLVKPIDVEQLRESVDRGLAHASQSIAPESLHVEPHEQPIDGMVGNSPAMQSVYKFIGRVAPEDVTVLILGESGTGKELVAREIFRHSQRRNRPFLVINCAALPEPLLESELFGHEKGAFTGADSRHRGKFEQAHGGSLFLDELGDMSLSTQAKILRVLQDGKFERIGGAQTIETDVRVVCATNHDLDRRIEQGLFRRDLLYRLNGFSVRLPRLRERLEDLSLLVEHFIQISNRQFGRDVCKISPDAMDQMLDYDWPGNVRELQSVVQFAVLHSLNGILTSESLPDLIHCTDESNVPMSPAFSGGTSLSSGAKAGGAESEPAEPEGRSVCLPDVAARVRALLASGESDLYRRIIAEAENVIIENTLNYFGGNQVQASRCLGISRTTLRSKMVTDQH